MNKRPKLRNLRPRTPEAAVVAQIRKLRPNLSNECPIRFFLYFATEDAANKAATVLRQGSFVVEVVPSIGASPWLCLATKDMLPETTTLVELRRDMVELACKYGGEYDGWEAEINDELGSAG